MNNSLILVENENQSQIFRDILGKDFLVSPILGNIKELTQEDLDLNTNNGYETLFQTTSKTENLLNSLRNKIKEFDQILIATSVGPEGENNALHLAQELGDLGVCIKRISFDQITKKIIKKAIQNPHKINKYFAQAHRARLIVNQLAYSRLKPVLKTPLKRPENCIPQVIALGLLCEKEHEIDLFTPQECYGIRAKLQTKKNNIFNADLRLIKGEKPNIPDLNYAKAVIIDLKEHPFTVSQFSRKKIINDPLPPFTTSTLAQAASERFGYTIKKTMQIAQQLYEGILLGKTGFVGLITHIYTDSCCMPELATTNTRELIFEDYGKEYIPKKPHHYESAKSQLNGNTAISPTLVKRTPKKVKRFLNEDQYQLYSLIWCRYIASQMMNATIKQTHVEIVAGPEKRYQFSCTDFESTSRGFLQVYDIDPNPDNSQSQPNFENLKINDELTIVELLPYQCTQKAPARLTEARFIQLLDQLKISFSFNFTCICESLLENDLIKKKNHYLMPSERGYNMYNTIIQNFPDIFNVGFLAMLEKELEQIAGAKKDLNTVLSNFKKLISNDQVHKNVKKSDTSIFSGTFTSQKCPICKSDLMKRTGRTGDYISCINYPTQCHFITANDNKDYLQGRKCEKCGHDMVVRVGRFGKFLACSRFPECTWTKPFPINVMCPIEGCTGEVVEKRSKKGQLFYGCSSYPECNFVSWNSPVNIACPECGNLYLEDLSSEETSTLFRCPKCKSRFDMNLDVLKKNKSSL